MLHTGHCSKPKIGDGTHMGTLKSGLIRELVISNRTLPPYSTVVESHSEQSGKGSLHGPRSALWEVKTVLWKCRCCGRSVARIVTLYIPPYHHIINEVCIIYHSLMALKHCVTMEMGICCPPGQSNYRHICI